MTNEGNFLPTISAQLNYLIAHSPFPMKVERVWSGGKYNKYPDRFTLFVSYCLDYVKWDILYNAEYPLAAPDVIFGPDDDDFFPFSFLSGQDGKETKKPKCSLYNWNPEDPSRLLSLILELRDEYVSYQRKRVGQIDDDRLKFEISTVLSKEGIEMHMSSGAEKPEEVKFAVPLTEFNINKMVPGCPWRHQQKIYLQVAYPVARKYGSAPSAPRLKLVSSPELKYLFSVDDVKLPSWSDGMCLAEYLPNLEESIEKQLLEAVSVIDARRRFLEALSLGTRFGRPVEVDSIFCRKATFLASSGTFTYMVQLFLSVQFPKQQPNLILQSCQHFNPQNTPIKSALIKDCPWSPRWDATEMAERLYDYLAEEALNFKRQCNEAMSITNANTGTFS